MPQWTKLKSSPPLLHVTWLLPTGRDRGSNTPFQFNIVIPDLPCQAINLIIVLIWNVGFISFPSPSFSCSFLSLLSTLLHSPSPHYPKQYQHRHHNHPRWLLGKPELFCVPMVRFPTTLLEITAFTATVASVCRYYNKDLNSFCWNSAWTKPCLCYSVILFIF